MAPDAIVHIEESVNTFGTQRKRSHSKSNGDYLKKIHNQQNSIRNIGSPMLFLAATFVVVFRSTLFNVAEVEVITKCLHI